MADPCAWIGDDLTSSLFLIRAPNFQIKNPKEIRQFYCVCSLCCSAPRFWIPAGWVKPDSLPCSIASPKVYSDFVEIYRWEIAHLSNRFWFEHPGLLSTQRVKRNVCLFLGALVYVQLYNEMSMVIVIFWAANGQNGEKMSDFDHLCWPFNFNVPLYNMTQL